MSAAPQLHEQRLTTALVVVEERLGPAQFNIGAELISARAYRNSLIWADRKNWVFGFYKGKGDSRLWVPRRMKNGAPHPTDLIINFRHPIGHRLLNIFYGLALIGLAALWMIGGAALAR